MSEQLRIDSTGLKAFVDEKDILSLQAEVEQAHKMLQEGTGAGNDFLGWVTLPSKIDAGELQAIREAAQFLKEEVDTLVVIGIGGSYLGARAVIEALGNSFHNLISDDRRSGPRVLFAGHHLDGAYHRDLMKYLEGKKFAINVISKSGTTTEPAVAFRMLRALLEKNVGSEEAKKLIFATTDAKKGALRTLADREGYRTFIIPDDVGGRYSVLTPVGLLPIVAAGIDIDALLSGAKDFQAICKSSDMTRNPAGYYAAARNALYRQGKKIEILIDYAPGLVCLGEWWKQLYGESEGKDGKGIFPAACHFTTDLHSMGQWIQDGERSIFETILQFGPSSEPVMIKQDPDNLDGLNFLAGKDLDDVNAKALAGTALAHGQGGVPSMAVQVPQLEGYWLGQLIYFFEYACGLSGYMLGVNPFDQPGVEAYKKNMFALIGKPGFEDLRAELEKQLGK